MEVLTAFGLSASAGLNAYIPLLIVALLARFTDLITLSSPWDTLESWWVIGLLVLLTIVEFFADKAPAVNHINDIIQTFVRTAAGAILFAASANVITDIHPVLALAMGILVAGSVHAAKSVVVRPAVTASTAGIGNTPVSMAEDILATATSLIALILPILIGVVLLCVAIIIIFWLYRRSKREQYA